MTLFNYEIIKTQQYYFGEIIYFKFQYSMLVAIIKLK